MSNWIKGAIKHPGSLHKELGVPEGEKIPASKLNAAAKKGGKEGERARLAKTLGKMHKEEVDLSESTGVKQDAMAYHDEWNGFHENPYHNGNKKLHDKMVKKHGKTATSHIHQYSYHKEQQSAYTDHDENSDTKVAKDHAKKAAMHLTLAKKHSAEHRKAMKEETDMSQEQLDELSNEKLSAYKKAAAKAPLAKDDDKTAGGILKRARKRAAGIKTADRKIKEHNENLQEEEQLDELVKGVTQLAKSLVGKSDKQVAARASKAFAARKAARKPEGKKDDVWAHGGYDTAEKRGNRKEEVELDGTELEEKVIVKVHNELTGGAPDETPAEMLKLAPASKLKMLGQAARNKYTSHTGVEVPGTVVHDKEGEQALPKSAIKAKVKEEVEQIEELSKNTLSAYAKAASRDKAEHDENHRDAQTAMKHARAKGAYHFNQDHEEHLDKKMATASRKSANRENGIFNAKARMKEEVVNEEGIVRKGDAVKGGGTDLVPPAIPTKVGANPYGKGAAKRKPPQAVIRPAGSVKEEAEELEEGMRLLGTHGNHGAGKSAKVYKDTEYGEHVVKFYTDGKHHKEADYHTDDKADAHGTAKQHVMNEEVEQIEELSVRTLGSYRQKATNDANQRVAKAMSDAGRTGVKVTDNPEAHASVRKAVKRYQGADRANAKIDAKAKTNEEVEQIEELSNELLGKYKKKAGADASAADKKGDFAKGNKRFSGIIKATNKQFDNDKKKVKEEIEMISFKDYLRLMTEEFTVESEELSEEFISHSEFEDKLNNHKSHGMVLHHDYDHKAKKAVIRHVDHDGEVREFHYHDKGTTVQRLAPRRAAGKESEATAPAKRPRGRQPGSKHTYKPRAK